MALKIREIMTRDPVCCESDTALQTVARMMADNDCGEIPVLDSQQSSRPVGVITDRDIVCRLLADGKNPLEAVAKDVMTTPVVTVPADASVDDALKLLEEHQIRRIVVVDDQGVCCGIVSQADIALKMSPKSAAAMVKEVSQSLHT